MLVGCVTQMPKKRNYTQQDSKRSMTRRHSIFGREICKIAFLGTLRINQCRIDTALRKQESITYGIGGRNAFPLCKKQKVCTHIDAFPRYVSHYCRNKTNAKF